ncbi:MAG: sulfotransferase domain-containing protein [Nitrospirota bacterium]
MISRSNMLRRVQNAYVKINNSMYRYGIRSTEKLSLPDFLGIGIDKAGTTWLYENLDKHKDIFVSRQKELNYFDVNIATRSLMSYSDNFKDGANKVKGEITPGYAYIPVSCIRFIRDIIPRVRLIFLIRNPVEQQWSFAVHQLARKYGTAVSDVPEYKFFELFKKNSFYRIGGYMGILNRWLSQFSTEQLYIGFYDDIRKQPRRLLTEVFNHIGVSSEIDWNLLPYDKIIVPPAGPQYRGLDGGRGVVDPKHRSSVSFMPDKYRTFLEEVYDDDIRALREMFGEKCSDWTHS